MKISTNNIKKKSDVGYGKYERIKMLKKKIKQSKTALNHSNLLSTIEKRF